MIIPRCERAYGNPLSLSSLRLFVFLSCLSGGATPLVICSDCYDNANIYSRAREYCPYAYITEEDPLEQTLPNLMVQMPKEAYTARTQREASALDTILADRDMSVFLTNHDKISEKKIPSQQMNGEWPWFPCGFVFPSSSVLAVDMQLVPQVTVVGGVAPLFFSCSQN